MVFVASLSPFQTTECLCEHQPYHVGRKPSSGVGPLRLAADPADLKSAGAGMESVCCGAGRTQHSAGDVCQLPPEGRSGTDGDDRPFKVKTFSVKPKKKNTLLTCKSILIQTS